MAQEVRKMWRQGINWRERRTAYNGRLTFKSATLFLQDLVCVGDVFEIVQYSNHITYITITRAHTYAHSHSTFVKVDYQLNNKSTLHVYVSIFSGQYIKPYIDYHFLTTPQTLAMTNVAKFRLLPTVNEIMPSHIPYTENASKNTLQGQILLQLRKGFK
jgi:hypothetical protein